MMSFAVVRSIGAYEDLRCSAMNSTAASCPLAWKMQVTLSALLAPLVHVDARPLSQLLVAVKVFGRKNDEFY